MVDVGLAGCEAKRPRRIAARVLVPDANNSAKSISVRTDMQAPEARDENRSPVALGLTVADCDRPAVRSNP